MKKKSKLDTFLKILRIITLIIIILSALPALFGKAGAASAGSEIATPDNAGLLEDFSQADINSIDNVFNSEFLSNLDTGNDIISRTGRYFFYFQMELSYMKSFDLAVSTPGWVASQDPEVLNSYLLAYNSCKQDIYIGTSVIISFTCFLSVIIFKFISRRL